MGASLGYGFGTDKGVAPPSHDHEILKMGLPSDSQPPPASGPEANEKAVPGLTLSSVRLSSLIQDFLKDYLHEKSNETVGTYRRSLREFERWFAQPERTFSFQSEEIEQYKTYLMEEKGLHQVSISTYLTALRRLCQYFVELGLLPQNPAKQVKGNRRPVTHSRRILTEADVEQVISTLPAVTGIDKRDRAIIYTMLFAGLSEIEIIRADVRDLEQTLMGWYLRIQGKGHKVKDQQVPIDPPVMDAMRLYLDTRGRIRPEDPLFVSHGHRSEGKRLNTRSIRSRINAHLEHAGVKRDGITPHSLTHTAALLWLNDGMQVEDVRQRMRHGTLETTMIYFRKQDTLGQTDS
jgi:integrase/recombinase XerC